VHARLMPGTKSTFAILQRGEHVAGKRRSPSVRRSRVAGGRRNKTS
jgi:hypothetical protein